MNAKPPDSNDEPDADPATETDEGADPASAWLTYAHADLAAAQHLATNTSVGRWVPAFHCQQAEKALKAALIAAGLPAPRIHRLVELHAAIPEPGLAHIDPDDLEELQPWAVVGRYPGDVPEISADELATLLSTATNVVSLVEKLTSRAS